jgi:hypothetical protein
VAAGAQRSASRLAREVITESFMVLSLPGRVLALGTHLTDAYPEALEEPADAELTELLARFEPVAPAADDCGARDWSDLDQRMHYIVHMFCAFHLNEQLLRPPFSPAQVASFSRGIVPEGKCDARRRQASAGTDGLTGTARDKPGLRETTFRGRGV